MSAPRRRTRATLRATEDEVQISIVDRWRFLQSSRQIGPEFKLFSIPNEDVGSAARGARLNALGRMAGVADLEILGPGGATWRGEVKNAIGKLSAAQRTFRDWCASNGVPWALWRSQDEAERSWREWGLFAEDRKVLETIDGGLQDIIFAWIDDSPEGESRSGGCPPKEGGVNLEFRRRKKGAKEDDVLLVDRALALLSSEYDMRRALDGFKEESGWPPIGEPRGRPFWPPRRRER